MSSNLLTCDNYGIFMKPDRIFVERRLAPPYNNLTLDFITYGEISPMSEETNTIALQQNTLLDLTTQVVAAYVGRNDVAPAQITDLIHTVFATLKDISVDKPMEAAEPPKPAVPIKRSVFPDYIVCLEDGKKLKMLKRHLRTAYNMTPDDYRAKWGLPADYPMVAPNYAEQRSQFAKQIGLGRTGLADVTRGRRKKATA